MSSRKKSSPSNRDSERESVQDAIAGGSESNQQPPQNSSADARETAVQGLVSLVLNEIAQYEASSLDYRVFEPLEPEHPLRQLVARLCELDPNAFMSGSQGKSLWRKVVRSSVIPSDVYYLRIFDDLEAFETWLVQHYGLTSTSELTVDVQQTSSRQVPVVDLTDTEHAVLQGIDNEPRRGKEIAKRAAGEYDTVRKILPRLIGRGLILKTRRGYVRVLTS